MKYLLSLIEEKCHQRLRIIIDLFKICYFIFLFKAMDIYIIYFNDLYQLHLFNKHFVKEQMDPCVKFLMKQLKFFKQNLFQEVFEKVVLVLWQFIVEVRNYHFIFLLILYFDESVAKKLRLWV